MNYCKVRDSYDILQLYVPTSHFFFFMFAPCINDN